MNKNYENMSKEDLIKELESANNRIELVKSGIYDLNMNFFSETDGKRNILRAPLKEYSEISEELLNSIGLKPNDAFFKALSRKQKLFPSYSYKFYLRKCVNLSSGAVEFVISYVFDGPSKITMETFGIEAWLRKYVSGGSKTQRVAKLILAVVLKDGYTTGIAKTAEEISHIYKTCNKKTSACMSDEYIPVEMFKIYEKYSAGCFYIKDINDLVVFRVILWNIEGKLYHDKIYSSYPSKNILVSLVTTNSLKENFTIDLPDFENCIDHIPYMDTFNLIDFNEKKLKIDIENLDTLEEGQMKLKSNGGILLTNYVHLRINVLDENHLSSPNEFSYKIPYKESMDINKLSKEFLAKLKSFDENTSYSLNYHFGYGWVRPVYKDPLSFLNREYI